jgi:hypothetical protein
VRAGDLEEVVSDGWGLGYSTGLWGQTWVKNCLNKFEFEFKHI